VTLKYSTCDLLQVYKYEYVILHSLAPSLALRCCNKLVLLHNFHYSLSLAFMSPSLPYSLVQHAMCTENCTEEDRVYSILQQCSMQCAQRTNTEESILHIVTVQHVMCTENQYRREQSTLHIATVQYVMCTENQYRREQSILHTATLQHAMCTENQPIWNLWNYIPHSNGVAWILGRQLRISLQFKAPRDDSRPHNKRRLSPSWWHPSYGT
jgi:hypothetical protein